jgi:hypothetical protein
MFVEAVGQPGNRDARVFHDELRHVDVDFVLDHQGGRTAGNGALCIAMPVNALASHGNKKAPRDGRARIDGDTRNRVGQRADDAWCDQRVEQRPKLSLHRGVFAPGRCRTKRAGLLGMTSASSIAVCASCAKIGAATTPP